MSIYGRTRSLLAEQLRAIGVIAETWGEPLLAGACWSELGRLQDGRLEMVVCGEFKVGKSMLINALIDQPGLTPVDFDIATSTLLMIRSGEVVRAFVVPLDGQEPTPIDAHDIPRWASEAHRNPLDEAGGIIVIEAPSPFLAQGLTLVDTPGISGLNREHSEITFAEVAKADLVLFVTESQRPLTTHELAFISDRILPLNASFALVVAKADLQPDLETVLEANREKLIPLLEAPPAIFPVSSLMKLRHLEGGDPQDLAESGHPVLEAHIDTVLKATGQARIIGRAATAARDAVEKLAAPRRIELVALERGGSVEFAQIKADIEEAGRQVDRLHRNRGEWRNRLTFEIGEIRTKIIDRALHRAMVELETDFHLAANATSAAGNELNAVARDLEVKIQHIYVRTRQDISVAVEELRVRLAADTGVPLTSIVRDEETAVRSPPALRTEKTLGWTTKVGDWANQWRRQVFGGLTVGAFIGGLCGGAIGLFAGGVGALPGFAAGMQMGASIGMLGGAATGIPSATKYLREKGMARARDALESQLGPYLRLVNKEIFDACHDLIGRLRTALAHEFELRIADLETDLKQRRTALERGLGAARETMTERAAVLRSEIGQIDQYEMAARGALEAFLLDEA